MASYIVHHIHAMLIYAFQLVLMGNQCTFKTSSRFPPLEYYSAKTFTTGYIPMMDVYEKDVIHIFPHMLHAHTLRTLKHQQSRACTPTRTK